MDNQSFKGVLIGGIPSSGSTLLSVMLDSHPELICGPELTIFSHSLLWNPENLTENNALLAWFSNDKCKGVLPWSKIDNNVLAYYLTDKYEIINWVNSCDNLFELGDKLFAKKMVESGANRWVEKTPQNIYALNSYLRMNEKATAIMTIRDPRAVIYSLMRRNISPQIASRIWVIEASIIYSLITDPTINQRLYLLRYEDLICDTKIVLSGLCQFFHISEEIDQMINRENSERLKSDQSLLSRKGTASYSWLCSPLNEISDKPLYAWKEHLNANVYDTLLHASVDRADIEEFVGSTSLIRTTELMDYFGYFLQTSYESPRSVFEEFYLNKVKLECKFDSRTDILKLIQIVRAVIRKIKLGIIHRRFSIIGRVIRKIKLGIIHRRFSIIGRVNRKINLGAIHHLKKNKIIQKYRAPIRQIAKSLRKKNQTVKKVITSVTPEYNEKYRWFEPKEQITSCNLVVVIAFSGRHEILRSVVNEAFNAEILGLDIAMVLSCTDEKDLKFAKQMQLKYKKIGIAQCDNNPLGNKWHIAVDCAQKFSPMALIITGSDDIVSADYLKNNFQHLMNDTLEAFGMVGPRVWYILEYKGETTESVLWRVAYSNEYHHMPLGAGRIYSAKYLDSINWQIFDRNLNTLLDDKGYYHVLEDELCVYSPTLDDGMIISVKGSWVAMNTLDVILTAESIVSVQVTGKEKEEVINKVNISMALMNSKN